MEIRVKILELIWVGSYTMAILSLIIFLFILFLRFLNDKKSFERLKRRRTLRRNLVIHLDEPDTNIKDFIKLQPEDNDILIDILQEISILLNDKRKKNLLKFLTDLGLYDEAVKQLKEKNIKLMLAIKTLSNWPDKKTKSYIIPYLNSSDKLIKITAIDSLAKMEAVELFSDILRILRTLNYISQPILANIFTKFGKKAIPLLVKVSKNRAESIRIRIAALLAISNIQYPDILVKNSKPINILKTSKPHIHKKHPGIIKYLITLIDDPEYEIRANALRVLEKMSDPKIIPAIRKGLEDDSWVVRLRAAYCAKKIHDKKLLKSLEKCLNDGNWLIELRSVEAIHSMNTPEGIKILKTFAKNDSIAGKHAAQLLEQA